MAATAHGNLIFAIIRRMGIKILGTGSYLPPKVLTNADIATALDTSDEWIFSHTGIHARHIAEEGETTSTMATKAAKAALDAAGLAPADVGLIVLATSTPDYNTFPSTACIVQGLLGCTNAGAYDLQAACAGFVYALEQARGWLACNPGQKALVIGSECLTRIVDWTDRSSCILFDHDRPGGDDDPRRGRHGAPLHPAHGRHDGVASARPADGHPDGRAAGAALDALAHGPRGLRVRRQDDVARDA